MPEAGRGLLRTCTLARRFVEPVNIIIGNQEAIWSNQDLPVRISFSRCCVSEQIFSLY
jgi:hypothetical protein